MDDLFYIWLVFILLFCHFWEALSKKKISNRGSYSCLCSISHVKVLGRPLSPAFDVEVIDSCGKFLLVYSPDALPHILETSSNGKDPDTSTNTSLLNSEDMLWFRRGGVRHFRIWQHFAGENQQNDDDDDHHAIGWDDDDEDEVDQSAL